MALLYVALITVQQGPPGLNLLAFLLLLGVQLALLTAWATLFSTYSGPTTATAFTLSVFVIGNLADDIWLFGQQAESAAMRSFSGAVYWLLPNFEVLNLLPQATHGMEVSGGFLLRAVAYGLGYAVVVLCAAIVVFQRRDFK
jgi:ABC-type transport system involved in multi-copper enzyme maturation permease subunit